MRISDVPPPMSAWRQSSRRCLSYGVGSTLGSRLSQRRRTSAKRNGGETVADILVIDDDDELRDTLRAILEAAGDTMHEARNGREGIACCQAYPIAMVLTDLLMPEQEGIETIRQFQTMQPIPKIIAMSGGGQMGSRPLLEIARVLGADRTLQKPIRARDLLATVQDLLAKT